ncbi:serine hydrolase domain-containing protein, partial [Caulobacter sp. 17J65-9]|uniref:serine hydrolase domain-containing protein n=1 Tax=Caulobacter sp. 17J65-9 TaxID=2709382 RepID=UPI0013CAF185
VLAFAAPAQAQAQAPAPEAAVDALFVWAGPQTPGCALAVERDGRRLMTRAWGSADLEHDVPVTADTVFEAGSVSKQFTAAAVLLLAADGKLSLKDDVRRWFPELPDYGQPITVEQLLNHTSGLRDWGSLEGLAGWPRSERVYGQADTLDMIARQKSLNYRPGAEWSYTNSGYSLAALLVERASGKSLADFTAERLFRPLGMTSTRWRDHFRAVVKNRAVAYQPGAGGWEQLMPFEDTHGHGGLLTTVGDLLVWNRALQADRFGLGEGLATRASLSDGAPTNYARGLFLDGAQGRRSVWHSGSTAGYRAFLARTWAEGQASPVSVAVLCNASNADAGSAARKAADAFLPPRPAVQAPLALRPPAGLYVDARTGFPLSLSVGGRELGGDAIELKRDGTFERRFADGNRALYRPAAPVEPAIDLQALAGRWTSDEIGATWVLSVRDGVLRLAIDRRPGFEATLRPVYRDAFTDGEGDLVRVIRDAAGRPVELSIGEARVRDLRFRRVG